MKGEQPLVSILITSYNYDRYLRQTIDSALNQTYSNTEVIVVDDGSTDNSRQSIESYKNSIIPIYKENGGEVSAINTGFAVSQGEIICFLDSDDVWLPQKVQKVVEAFNTYPNASVIYHKVQNIDAAGKLTDNPWPPYKPIKGDISSRVTQTGGWWPFPPTTALSFSRKFLSQVMNIPEEDKVCADAYLADLAPFFGEVVGIDQVLSYYRYHGSNMWNNPAGVPKDVQAIRRLQDHELREKMLNNYFQNLGINRKVSLADHWPYQLLKYKQGKKENLVFLSLLILRNPWEHRLIAKLKNVALLWLQRRSFSRI